MPISVSPHSVVGVDGKTTMVLAGNLADAPVPDRRYLAELASIVYKNETVQFLFAQEKLSSSLRSLLVIHMSTSAARSFASSVEKMSNPSLEEIAKITHLAPVSLPNINDEPDQTVALVANRVGVAVSGREASLDFYQVSISSLVNMITTNKIGVEPVVRVDIRTSLLIALIKRIRELQDKFPPDEIQEAL